MSIPYSPNNNTNKIITPGNVQSRDLIQSDISRILPRQQSTGVLRGTQSVGYGDTKIDASNNRIVLGSSAGTGNVGSIVLDGNTSSIVVSNNITIDGVSDAIIVTHTDGSKVGMGKIPNSNDFGFFSIDKLGNLIMKIVDGTTYVYNPKDNFVNVTQSGLLPDGSGGFVVANPGKNVSNAYS
jgi:hypothetical protein